MVLDRRSLAIALAACASTAATLPLAADPIPRDLWRSDPVAAERRVEPLRHKLLDLSDDPAGLSADEAASLTLRKAELLFEIAQVDHLVALNDRRDCLARAAQRRNEPNCPDLPTPDFAAASDAYLDFLTRHPDHPQADLALFHLGWGLMAMGRDRRAANVLEHLLSHHRGSRFIPDAHLIMAEFWFDRGMLQDARHSYEAVITRMGSPLLDYALYKLAWIHHLLDDHRHAVRMLEEVIALTRAEPDRQPILETLYRELEQMRAAR